MPEIVNLPDTYSIFPTIISIIFLSYVVVIRILKKEMNLFIGTFITINLMYLVIFCIARFTFTTPITDEDTVQIFIVKSLDYVASLSNLILLVIAFDYLYRKIVNKNQ